MLGLLCNRPSIISSSLSSSLLLHHHSHYLGSAIQLYNYDLQRRNQLTDSPSSSEGGLSVGSPASIWHEILPAGKSDWRNDYLLPASMHHEQQKGEGSWNVAWDARPARWIYRVDLAWLLFGVCAWLAPIDWKEVINEANGLKERKNEGIRTSDKIEEGSGNYRVTGVPADGRCLFRALAHGACLQNGEEAPDENRQKELADELRAQVVEELLKRREETEWFIEGDFDAYVKRIKQPFVWGGEPELLMASHVLKTSIHVYMKDRSSGIVTKIAIYGEEYEKEKEFPINVLFYGYGHYDLIETCATKLCQKSNSLKL